MGQHLKYVGMATNGNWTDHLDKIEYLFNIDDRLPLRLAIIYALQWVLVIFPILVTSAILPAKVLHMTSADEVRFLQLILLSSGFFTLIQCLWGHRYPVVDGPSAALLLSFMAVAPYGLPAAQAGGIVGGVLLMAVSTLIKPNKIIALMTPNVIGVILMLISLTLLPYLSRMMSGAGSNYAEGSVVKFLFSTALVILMSAMACRFKGFFKSIWLITGMIIGTAAFFVLDRPLYNGFFSSPWFSIPPNIVPSQPRLRISAVIAFAVSYVAVMVNSVGSIEAIANITDRERLKRAVPRGLFLNGVAGVFCGFMGIVGLVSYSTSPGIVLSLSVASRFAVAWCGLLLILAALIPKLAALFALIPTPVIGAAMCTALSVQIGAALEILTKSGIEPRSYYVIGLPVVLGTLIGFLPQNIINESPQIFRVFLGNGLIFGILLVLILEHVIMRKKQLETKQKTFV